MNFGPQTDRGRQPRDHGPRARARASTSSTPPTSTAGRRARASPSRSSAAGSRRAAAGARRTSSPPRCTAAMSDWPNDDVPLGAATSAAPARRRCGGCRPTTSTSTRCTTSTATTPWDEIWQAMEVLRPAGQGPLRRLVATSPAGTSPRPRRPPRARHFLGLVSEQSHLQPADPRRRARGAAGRAATTASASSRGRRCTAACSAASSASSAEGTARALEPARAKEALEEHRAAIEAYEELCDELGEDPADVALAWLLHQAGRDRADRRPAHDGAARRRRCAPLEITLDDGLLARLDEIFPRPAASRPRRPTPGRPPVTSFTRPLLSLGPFPRVTAACRRDRQSSKSSSSRAR